MRHPAPTRTGCVTLGKGLDLSELQCLRLKTDDDCRVSLVRFLPDFEVECGDVACTEDNVRFSEVLGTVVLWLPCCPGQAMSSL